MGRRWRRVFPSLYLDARFRALSGPGPNARSLLLYLRTGPETVMIPGIVGAGAAALAEALGWPLSGFRRAFRELEAADYVRADWPARLVFLPGEVADNPPENPNVAKAWRTAFEELPECGLRDQAFEAVRTVLEGLGERFVEPFAEPLRKGLAIQEQKQEQKQEQDPPQPPTGEPGDSRVESLDWLGLLNREAGRAFKPTTANLQPIKARLKEGFTRDQAEVVVRHKVGEWKGTERAQYLRPVTIFGNKFDGYLQAATNGARQDRRRVNDAWAGKMTGEVKL